MGKKFLFSDTFCYDDFILKGVSMAHRIQELLDKNGYRPATFAKKAGISQSTLAEILSGKRDFNNVGVSKILAMAKAFGVTVEYLSGDSDIPTPQQFFDELNELNNLFDQLNDEGKNKLLDYADDLVSSGKYEKKEMQDHSVSSRAAIA